MIVIKHFRGHILKTHMDKNNEACFDGVCKKCKTKISFLRQYHNNYYVGWASSDGWLNAPYTTDLSQVPRCEEITMNEALS